MASDTSPKPPAGAGGAGASGAATAARGGDGGEGGGGISWAMGIDGASSHGSMDYCWFMLVFWGLCTMIYACLMVFVDEPYGCFHSHGGTPIAGCLRWENPNYKWMRTGGSSILGNQHMVFYRGYLPPS